MLSEKIPTSSRLFLRCLSEPDVGQKYLGWLNDPEVNKFLEVRHAPPTTIRQLWKSVDAINGSPDSILFGIFLIEGSRHIGNIKLGPINAIHHRSELGLLIGESSEWGKGLASEAISLVCQFANEEFDIRRVLAGCYHSNEGSKRAFLKAGFFLEASIPDFWLLADGSSTGEYILGWSPDSAALPGWPPHQLENICFIGSGMAMVKAMKVAQKLGFQVASFLATRHAAETLSNGLSLTETLEFEELPYQVVDTVAEINPEVFFSNTHRTLAICMGPAWVFPTKVRDSFGVGMVNFNGIPIPEYLGGAHHTWQILNNSRNSGCYIQEITAELDRGDILAGHNFRLPMDLDTPAEFFQVNEQYTDRFLEAFLDSLHKGASFSRLSFNQLNLERLYFPRLSTLENGWIDWSWDGRDIAIFCRAFGNPYPGARTLRGDEVIVIKKSRFIAPPKDVYPHPFSAGLVVRSLSDRFFVAVSDGLLEVQDWSWVGSGSTIREGDRLLTDTERLLRARTHRPNFN